VIAMVMLAASLICYSYYQQMQGMLAEARAEHERVAAQIAAGQLQNERNGLLPRSTRCETIPRPSSGRRDRSWV
jgi:hypothetical protein